MKKELSEMSLEELWERFSIFLVAHKDEWKIYYLEMESFLKTILSGYPVERISHNLKIPGLRMPIRTQKRSLSGNGRRKPKRLRRKI